MKKSISTAMMAIGAFILIFCIAFTVVQLVCSDFGFFEREFIKLGLDSSMNMTVGDISKGLQALVDYMNGKVDSIDVDVMINGVRTPMYVLDIEHIHMEEVREVWRGFDTARNLGFLVAALLALGSVMTDNRHTLRNAAVGYLWALGVALLLCLFAGVWVASSFNSFWTQFHKIIFPNSENWLLPASSRMIQMLPGELFQDVVVRCGLIIILVLVVLGAGALVALALPKRKLVKASTMEKHGEVKEESTIPQQQGPDLVLMHKLLNMSVSRRKKAAEELALQRQQEEARKRVEEEKNGEEENAPLDKENARVKIDFAAYEGEALEPQIDEEEQEEAEWFRSLKEKQEQKEKQAAKGTKTSGKKKKKKAPVKKQIDETGGEEPGAEALVDEKPVVEEKKLELTQEESPIEIFGEQPKEAQAVEPVSEVAEEPVKTEEPESEKKEDDHEPIL